MSDASAGQFAADHPEYVAEPSPVTENMDGPSPASDESPAQKRVKLMSSGALYRDSIPHQAAAQTWAVVELVEATAAQTAVLTEQNAILARQAEIAQQQLAESRANTILRIYTADPRQFPEGVLDQMKAWAGITVEAAAAAATTPAQPTHPAPELSFS